MYGRSLMVRLGTVLIITEPCRWSLSSMMSVGCLVGVSGTGLPLVVEVLVCSLGEWFVIIPTAPLDSGDIMGVDADASGFSVAADLSSLRCLRFLGSDFPDEVSTIYDLGSTHLYVTTAGDQLLESGSYTRTRCLTSLFGRSWMCWLCWHFWYDCLWYRWVAIFSFWVALLGHLTGKFPSCFRLNSSSPGDVIIWSIGGDRKHSNIISKSRLLEAACCIADFMACTQRSAKPFDWGYLRDDVLYSNPHSL